MTYPVGSDGEGVRSASRMVWCDREGRFLGETGHYLRVPCDRCSAHALVFYEGLFLCEGHFPARLGVPEWLKLRRENGFFPL